MKQSKFFHYFPIPTFLAMKDVGLSIDNSCVRFIEIVDSDEKVTVTKYGTVEFPPQAIIEGEIVNTEGVKAALTSIRTQHGIHFSQFALPDDKVYVFKLRLPSIPENEVKSALEFKIDENIPLAAPEAIFDYVIVGNQDSLGIDVVVSAVARNTSQAYNELLKASGIQPLHFGLESQAIANAVVPHLETGTFIIINFFPHKTTISIVEKNVVQFSLSLRKEGITEASTGNESFVSGNGAAESTVPPKYLSGIRQELERVLNYWHDKSAMKGSDWNYKVIICGAEALNPAFVESFSKLIETPVLVANPWCNVYPDETHVPPISKEESFKYAAAIGLAIGNRITPHTND